MTASDATATGRVTVRDVLRAANARAGIDLRTVGRTKAACHYKFATWKAMRDVTAASFPRIAQFFGDMDHTTIMSGVKRADRQLAALIARDALDASTPLFGGFCERDDSCGDRIIRVAADKSPHSIGADSKQESA